MTTNSAAGKIRKIFGRYPTVTCWRGRCGRVLIALFIHILFTILWFCCQWWCWCCWCWCRWWSIEVAGAPEDHRNYSLWKRNNARRLSCFHQHGIVGQDGLPIWYPSSISLPLELNLNSKVGLGNNPSTFAGSKRAFCNARPECIHCYILNLPWPVAWTERRLCEGLPGEEWLSATCLKSPVTSKSNFFEPFRKQTRFLTKAREPIAETLCSIEWEPVSYQLSTNNIKSIQIL